MENIYFILFTLLFAIIGWFSTSGVKSQYVRLLDIFVYGTFLIWLSTKKSHILIKLMLLFMGVTTITYNARNFLHEKNKKKIKDEKISNPASW